ncbi:division/cell wall cluster transcriptional repressor MraZ [Mesobaculum littorinae]|uniref:division/cell wall cluster transcriptional repressor MraZ n=1 Tax=Mesobaculum littorinae TaxID=2486419 RepID=UPI001F213C75|nr:division/cell wall cluster transcriptional repressor MraZ [Mesobaculum littorinae]
MVQTFRGDHTNPLDSKSRVSIPADFRKVLDMGDPDREAGTHPRVVIVYGDHKRHHLECYTITAIDEIDEIIKGMSRGSKRRRALQRLFNGQSVTVSMDETGRLVLSARLRAEAGLDKKAYIIGNGDTFQIWNPETFDELADADLDADEDFDPDIDPTAYL